MKLRSYADYATWTCLMERVLPVLAAALTLIALTFCTACAEYPTEETVDADDADILFVSKIDVYTLEEIERGALCLNHEASPPRISADAGKLLPEGSWLDYEWVVKQWGAPHHVSQQMLPGNGSSVELLTANYEEASTDTQTTNTQRLLRNGAYVAAADGRIYAVGGRRNPPREGLTNLLPTKICRFGTIPLFGTYKDLTGVLGTAQYVSPVIGGSFLAEWFYLIGESPNRIALDIVAIIRKDFNGIAEKVTVRIAHEMHTVSESTFSLGRTVRTRQ